MKKLISLLLAVLMVLGMSLGLTAMAGAVGAGGLGDFAIRYGHNRFQEDVTVEFKGHKTTESTYLSVMEENLTVLQEALGS